MFIRRMRIIRTLFIFLLVLITVRIFNIQAISGKQYATAAALQQTRNLRVYKERGDILDRNGIRLTGRDSKWQAILQPATLLSSPTKLRIIADIFNITTESLSQQLAKSNLPYIMEITPAQAKAIADSSLEGISVIDMRVRNSSNNLAAHMVGYVDEKEEIGLAGIEKAYQNTLKVGGGVYAGVIADAGNSYMQDFGYRIWSNLDEKTLNVKLTLDYHMQRIVEETMDRMVDKGAVVVLDILTGDVLAIASRPNFDPSNINLYLNDEDQPLFNRALGAYTPGSIFKIVTASAALEQGLSPDLTYNCPGYVEMGSTIMKCSSYERGGHGTLNMAQAFARSCNSYFIHLGLEVGWEALFDMAVRLGLGHETGLSDQGINEPAGEVPSIFGYVAPAEIANLSIGQGSLLVSPVQAANLTAVIANGGLLNKVSIVDSIINSDGDRVRNVRFPSWERVLSKETATSLQGMMLLTVESGTGGLADIKGYGGSAGKTGSAETGWVKDNRNILHAWFSGYFPIDAPRYAMCVFVEDGKSGGSSAAPIFAEISAKIMDAGF